MASGLLAKDYLFIWLALVLAGLCCRPLMPVDETRAVSVAWDMWQRGDFLVPYLNGKPYSHKPPLLQWCIHLTWLLVGVNEWSARLIAPWFALGNLGLTAKLSRRLWPDDKTSPTMAPLILLTLPIWALWSSLTLYDMLATFFTLLALFGIVRAAAGEMRLGWAMVAGAIGFGLLSKGPAILIMILPAALFAPGWLTPKTERCWRAWYTHLLAAFLLGLLIALAWAIPAGFAGGEAYRNAIFWNQTAGRISHAFAHQRPLWWYVAVLPIFLLPWTSWPPLWRSAKGMLVDSGVKFCVVQSLSGLALFSLVSGKQIHYLLPLFPILALLMARALTLAQARITRWDQTPFGLFVVLLVSLLTILPHFGLVLTASEAAGIINHTPTGVKLCILAIGIGILAWRPSTPVMGVRVMAWAMLGLFLGVHVAFRQVGWTYYSMQNFADRLAVVEKQGASIAYWKKYNGDFTFLGRLQHPLTEINDISQLLAWMREHPQDYVVLVKQPDAGLDEDGAAFAQNYRGGRRIMLWKSTELTRQLEKSRRPLD